MTRSESDDKILSYVPLLFPILGAGLAITFDVGYFWGIDINLFTLFSLQEHIVFSLEAIPYAVIILICLVVLHAVAARVIRIRRPMRSRLKKNIEAARRVSRFRFVLNWLLEVLFKYSPEIVIALIAMYQYRSGAYRSFSLSIIIIALILAKHVGGYESDGFRRLTLVTFVILGMTGAFLFGHFVGAQYLLGGEAEHELKLRSGDVAKVRVVRAGERGVLFVDPASHGIIFRTWQDVDFLTRRIN